MNNNKMKNGALLCAGAFMWMVGNLFAQTAGDGAKGAKEEISKTEITATEGATADLENRTATFSGDVRVLDSRFQMKTRSLTVVFSKDPAGLESAVASGGVVIIQTQTEGEKKEDPAIGRAERAVYTASTGEIELSGTPILEQGANRHVSTSPATKMFLSRSGKLRTVGPNRTEIIDRSKSKMPIPTTNPR